MSQFSKDLLRRFVGVLSMAAIASFVTLPGGAQTMRPGETTAPNTENTMSPEDATSSISILDEEFFTLAYQGNNAEIQTSQLALERSQDQDIRQYAQRMISEHTLANEELTRLATQLNIALPDEPVDPLNQAIALQLSQRSDTEFNQAYMGVQANAHLRTIALYQTQIAQGQAPALKTYASQLLPSIGEHYQMASEMLPQYAVDVPRSNESDQSVQ
jgi:putative membrane protein